MTDRERFEAWMVGRDGEEAIQKDAQGVYGYWDTRQSWDAWQASRKQALDEARAECLDLIENGPSTTMDDVRRNIAVRLCAMAIEALANPEGEQG